MKRTNVPPLPADSVISSPGEALAGYMATPLVLAWPPWLPLSAAMDLPSRVVEEAMVTRYPQEALSENPRI